MTWKHRISCLIPVYPSVGDVPGGGAAEDQKGYPISEEQDGVRVMNFYAAS